MKYLFLALALLAGVATAGEAGADDLIVSRAVLEDPSGNLAIAEVAGREFKPVGPTLSKGYTRSVHWLRLQVRRPAKGTEAVLFIRPPFLNEVRLYEADAGAPQGWRTRVTGNHHPYRERDRATSSLSFVVDVTAPEVTYYLRLKTSTVSQLSVQALEPQAAEHLDHQFDLLELFFVTSMLLLLFWALHSYFLDRHPVVGLFALHQGVYTLYGVGVTGYLAPFVPEGFTAMADLSSAIPYCAVSFTTLLFCRELFKPYQPAPLLMRGLNLLLLAFPLQFAAIAFGQIPVAVVVNAVLVKATWWYFVIVVFSLRKEYAPSRRQLQIFFVVITLVFTLFWISNRKSDEGFRNNLYGRQVLIANGLLIGGLFSLILHARSRRLQQEAQQSALELQAKSEFLALVSHEIRTPLNALVGFSSLVRSTPDPAKLDEYHAILEQSSRSLMTLVNGILDLSKIEAGRMELEAVAFDLRHLIGTLEAQYRPLAEQKKLEMRFALADDVPGWVIGDPLRLRQILDNLLGNALKFTDSGDVSCCVTRLNGACAPGSYLLRFEVRDTGVGFPESCQEKLFQPFQQLDPTISRQFGGTGLGLAIVRNLALMMKGRITVKSREGAGSVFGVELPLEETEPLPQELQAPPLPKASRSVLVVEDNDFNRRLLGDILLSWGQQVTLAVDGEQALQYAQRHIFDLILLDIRMPGMDGIEVARRIRLGERERAQGAVPIIAVSADVDAATRAACLAAGMDAVLAKPVSAETLARAMAEHTGELPEIPAEAGLQLSSRTLSALGGSSERTRKYRELLMRDIDHELERLQDAHERDNHLELRQSAHTLKGLLGYLAGKEPAEMAAWLQENVHSAPPEKRSKVIGALRELCQGALTGEASEEYS